MQSRFARSPPTSGVGPAGVAPADDKGSSRGADTLKATTLFYGLDIDLRYV